ncbi:hypothetical protein RJ640_020521 [Escallonia rubra]|uniref:Polyprotein n=1 Tax=Escallonia rubra TaxID=112253 RepID=A0AA88U7W7_9ASTE|nr:hypothetical protein RJ640_020521 [Escallonia rubra]
MSMMGELTFFLGLQIKQSNDGIFINQAKYTKELLKRFDMEASNAFDTPMSSSLKLDKDEKGKDVDIKRYRALKVKQGLPDMMFADEKEDMLERAIVPCCWHYRKDCPEHKGKKNDNSKMADAGVVEDNSDGADVLSVTIKSSNGGWILDTGCSYHMCPNRDLFATYRSFDGGKVLMGNNVACKVVGIGSIQIRMHDGIVRTLTDVKHVSELRKYLISLGTLDSKCCSYRAVGGVMRIMKGALVVMKRLKQNILYLLQGSMVTGAVATASSPDIDSHTTKLWHMRLRHMSERGMDVLSK